MRNALRIVLLALILWGGQWFAAAEPMPLAEAMHERSALSRALTNQFARPGDESLATASHTVLNLGVALLIAALLAALRLPPPLLRRVRSWLPNQTGPDDRMLELMNDPSILAFFESLKEGPAEPVAGEASLATQAQTPTRAPRSNTTPELLEAFYDATPRRVDDLGALFSEISRAPDEAARQDKLLQSFERASALRESAELPEVLPIWQVVFALEGLLKRLSIKPADLSPSVLRTMAGALDLLEHLCRQRVKPDLVTEPPVRILVVDDDPVSRRAMSLALVKLFKAPELAPDGRVALDLAGRQTYDMIFLDVEMPGMDGYELCANIHETQLNRTTPVVFVTRHSDFDSRAKSTVNGGNGLLGKPFLVFEVILKAITLVLQGRLGRGTAGPRTASIEGSRTPAAPVSLSSRVAPDASKCPSGLSLDTLAPLQGLYQRLQAAQPDAEPAGRVEFLSELYLAVHEVCSEAQRAELNAAFRLGSALESMLKKLLEHPKSWTPSNVQAAAAALDLFLDVCRTGANPDLAHPPVELLVVDDDPVARRAISGTLQLAFGRPDSVASGEAALRLAREKPFDLIFLDVQMPGMDGFDACCRIHQTPLNRLTPVVFVTAFDDSDSRAKAAASGGCGFVPKQVLASQLKLVALSFILRGRLGRHIPPLEASASLTGNGAEHAPLEFAEPKAQPVASAVEVAG
jgi:CheY-like chemotaxis protein